jgi:hypothetical protein
MACQGIDTAIDAGFDADYSKSVITAAPPSPAVGIVLEYPDTQPPLPDREVLTLSVRYERGTPLKTLSIPF